MDVMQRIDEAVKKHPVFIFMKGTPQFPSCGFSSRTAEALKQCGKEFGYCNVLADPEIFENLPRYADWQPNSLKCICWMHQPDVVVSVF